MVVYNPKNKSTLRHDWINNFPVNLFIAPMALIGKFYNTFSNIVTMVLMDFQYVKNDLVFKGILHSDLNEEQVPENVIFHVQSVLG